MLSLFHLFETRLRNNTGLDSFNVIKQCKIGVDIINGCAYLLNVEQWLPFTSTDRNNNHLVSDSLCIM